MATQANLTEYPIIEITEKTPTHVIITKDGIHHSTISYIVSLGQWAIDKTNTRMALYNHKVDAIQNALQLR